ARAALQVGLVRQPLEELVDREYQMEREAGEQIADFPHLPFIASRDQQLRLSQGLGHRPAVPRRRASRWVVDAPFTRGTRTPRPPRAPLPAAPRARRGGGRTPRA